MEYSAPLWLPSGHLQTIYPATCIRKPAVAYRRERWQAPDGDFIDVDFVDGERAPRSWCCSTAWKAPRAATTHAP